MKRLFKIIVILLIPVFLLMTCKKTPSGSDTEAVPEYTLDVTIDPQSGNPGTVNPSGGTYEENEIEVIEALPNSNWQFDRWGGASTSSNNPITIKMDSDKTLVAYFVPVNSVDAFQAKMNVSDGTNRKDNLVFALLNSSSNREGLDDNDVESPPIAPPRAFFTGFKHDGMNLYEDYRPINDNQDEVIWELRLERNSSKTMNIDWSFTDNVESGKLNMVSDPSASNPAIEVDMLTQSSYSVTDPSVTSLFIVYSASQAKLSMSNNDSGMDNMTPTGRDIPNTKERKDLSDLKN